MFASKIDGRSSISTEKFLTKAKVCQAPRQRGASGPWGSCIVELPRHRSFRGHGRSRDSHQRRWSTCGVFPGSSGLTSDHGGAIFGHFDPFDHNQFTIPFYVWGGGAEAGGDLYAMNPFTRASPGLSTPTYTEPLQPIRNGDSGNLALSLLGLPVVDGSSINAVQDLIVTLPADLEWNGDDASVGMAGDGTSWRDEDNWTRNGAVDKPFLVGDRVTFLPGASQDSIGLQGDQIVTSVAFEADYTLTGDTLTITSGNIIVDDQVTATISSKLSSPTSLIKTGEGHLQLEEATANLFVSEGGLGGNTVVFGSVVNSGEITPGNSIGTMTIVGDLISLFPATLSMEVFGSDPGVSHDQIIVSGFARFDGILAVSRTDGNEVYAEPSQRGDHDEFSIVRYAARGGAFRQLHYNGVPLTPSFIDGSSLRSHQGGGLFRSVIYGATSAELQILFAEEGDADGDQDVDITDFNFLASNFDPTGGSGPHDWTHADFDGDDDVDITDFGFLAANFAPNGYGVSDSLVPEPSAWLLIVLGLSGLGSVSRRHFGSPA